MEHARRAQAKALRLEVRENLASLVGAEGVGLHDREGIAIGHGQDPMSLRTMSLRVRKPTSRPSCTTGTRSTSLLVIKLATSAIGWSGETHSTWRVITSVSYTHLRAHETDSYL